MSIGQNKEVLVMDNENFAILRGKYDIDEEILNKYLLKYKQELELIRNFQLDARTEPK